MLSEGDPSNEALEVKESVEVSEAIEVNKARKKTETPKKVLEEKKIETTSEKPAPDTDTQILNNRVTRYPSAPESQSELGSSEGHYRERQ